MEAQNVTALPSATDGVKGEEASGPTEQQLADLEITNYVCDYETNRILWEAQAICRLIDDAMDGGDSTSRELVQLAVQGVDRILGVGLQRIGWKPIN